MKEIDKYTFSGEIGAGGIGVDYCAQAYCQWLTQKTGRNFRLPGEAELIHSANHSSEQPNRRLNVSGFRVAMDHR